MKRLVSLLVWLGVACLGAGALGAIALSRGEPVNGIFFVAAAGCTYLVAYRFYSAFFAAGVLSLDATRATPAERLDDGRDFVPTNKWVLFGHHFAAIAGAGPLVGPVLAAQFGYLPGTIWIVFGVVLAGAVQDFIILFGSMRRDGRSLGQMAKEEIGEFTGLLAMVAILVVLTYYEARIKPQGRPLDERGLALYKDRRYQLSLEELHGQQVLCAAQRRPRATDARSPWPWP